MELIDSNAMTIYFIRVVEYTIMWHVDMIIDNI